MVDRADNVLHTLIPAAYIPFMDANMTLLTRTHDLWCRRIFGAGKASSEPPRSTVECFTQSLILFIYLIGTPSSQ